MHRMRYWLPLVALLATSAALLFSGCEDSHAPVDVPRPQMSATAQEQHDGLEVLYGPHQFVRATGKPVTETVTIFNPFLEHFTQPLYLRVMNGDEDGDHRVSSATIVLGGTEVVRQSDFSQKVGELSVEVTLEETSELSIRIESKPGSCLTIWIEGRLKPGRILVGPEGGVLEGKPGTRLEPGAFQSPAIVSVQLADEEEFAQALSQDVLGTVLGGIVVGPVVSIEATSTFEGPIEMTLPYRSADLSDPADADYLFVLSLSDDGVFEIQAGDPDGESDEEEVSIDEASQTVTTVVYHFSRLALARLIKRDGVDVVVDHHSILGCPNGNLWVGVIDDQEILGSRGLRARRRTVNGVVLHSTMTPDKRARVGIERPISNGYATTTQAHYYVDRDVDTMVVLPADTTIPAGASFQLTAEPRAKVYRLVPDNYIAAHEPQRNARSIGIEIFQHAGRSGVGTVDDDGVGITGARLYDAVPFTQAQYGSIRELLRGLMLRNPGIARIEYHSEVRPPRNNYYEDDEGNKIKCPPNKWRRCGKVDPYRINNDLARENLGTCDEPGPPVDFGIDKDRLFWKSSNPSVATVDQNGVVTGVAGGDVIITVVDFFGTEATAEVTVERPIPALWETRESRVMTHPGGRYYESEPWEEWRCYNIYDPANMICGVTRFWILQDVVDIKVTVTKWSLHAYAADLYGRLYWLASGRLEATMCVEYPWGSVSCWPSYQVGWSAPVGYVLHDFPNDHIVLSSGSLQSTVDIAGSRPNEEEIEDARATVTISYSVHDLSFSVSTDISAPRYCDYIYICPEP